MSQSDAGYERLSQQMQTLEIQAKEQVTLLKAQQERLKQREQDFEQAYDSDDQSMLPQKADNDEVKKQSRLLDESQMSLAVVFAQLRAARTLQEIGNVTTDQESYVMVGIPESLAGMIDQRIGNVSTTSKASAAVGYFDKNVDMRNFFRRAG